MTRWDTLLVVTAFAVGLACGPSFTPAHAEDAICPVLEQETWALEFDEVVSSGDPEPAAIDWSERAWLSSVAGDEPGMRLSSEAANLEGGRR